MQCKWPPACNGSACWVLISRLHKMISIESVPNSEFWSFLWLDICSQLLSCNPGHHQWTTVFHQYHCHRHKPPPHTHTSPCSVYALMSVAEVHCDFTAYTIFHVMLSLSGCNSPTVCGASVFILRDINSLTISGSMKNAEKLSDFSPESGCLI